MYMIELWEETLWEEKFRTKMLNLPRTFTSALVPVHLWNPTAHDGTDKYVRVFTDLWLLLAMLDGEQVGYAGRSEHGHEGSSVIRHPGFLPDHSL